MPLNKKDSAETAIYSTLTVPSLKSQKLISQLGALTPQQRELVAAALEKLTKNTYTSLGKDIAPDNKPNGPRNPGM